MTRSVALVFASALFLGREGALAGTLESYSFTNLDKSVPDGNGAGMSDAWAVSSAIRAITGVRVRLHIAGEFNGDLYGYLRHAQGATTNLCVLLNRPGRRVVNAAGYQDPGLDVVFDDAALSGNIHAYASVTNIPPGMPLTGTWQPDGRKVDPTQVLDTTPITTTLSGFNGGDASGTWTLFLADMACGGTNMLVSWGLDVSGLALPAVTWPTPADIVYGTVLGAGQLDASASVPGTFAYSPSAGTVLNAGNAQSLTVIFTPSDSSSYLSVTSNVSINVSKLTLTVTACSTNKVYGAALPGLTASYSGFVNGDTVSSLSAPAVLGTTASAGSGVGIYPITASGASGGNYGISYVAGTLTIVKAGTLGIVSSSRNPSPTGQSVAFTFAVNAVAPGAGTLTGTVQFKADGANVGGAMPINAGAVSYTTSTLAHGSHTVAAEYAGDGNFIGTTNSLSPNQLVNSPPVAGADTIERWASAGTKVPVGTLLTNDSDPDGDAITMVWVSSTSTNGGSITWQGEWIYYTPLTGFTNTDLFTYTIADSFGAMATGTVLVEVMADAVPSPNLTITNPGGGSYLIQFDGIPGATYGIEYSETSTNLVWLLLGTATADPMGLFYFIDTPSGSSGQRFYRSVWHP